MITICNRREVRITRSMEEVNAIRERLDAAGILHTVRRGGVQQSSRMRGAPGMQWDAAYDYRIYVHKRDEERARAALR